MRMPTAVKTRTPTINIETVKGGPIVPYRPPVNPSPSPQVITPQPRGTYSSPPPRSVPPPQKPDIIDAEIVKSVPRSQPGVSSRRPVADSSASPSSQSARPDYYPQYPNPADGWKSTADFVAWQNGRSRESLDEERLAYEFTKDWGKTGGVLYPFTENGPRTPIVSENLTKANRFRARHGLPSIDRYGHEQSMPVNPSNQPGQGFGSNPFKTVLPDTGSFPATPANFPEDPYNWDIDPDTGLPFTDLQKERGRDLGRPAWHIDPTTGNPWGDDETGTPAPNPFQGYPGGSVRYPVKNPTVTPSRWAVPAELTHSNPLARGRGRYVYYVDSVSRPTAEFIDIGPQPAAFGPSNGTSRTIGFFVNGVEVANNGNGDTTETGAWELFGFSWGAPYPVGFSAQPNPGGDLEADPIGAPLPQIRTKPAPRVSPDFAPAPVQDPRVNPFPAPTLPGMPVRTLPENPNTQPQSPKPAPSPVFEPLPSIPGQPNYAPLPQPYPRSSPAGQPQPAMDPQAQPQPARPRNPAPTTTIDRPKKPPVNPAPNPGECDPCPDPCESEPLVKVRYKRFVGCNITPLGVPDYFRETEVEVPEKSAKSIVIMLNSLADIQAAECAPCCYWDLIPGVPVQLFSGLAPLEGLNVPLPQGCNSIVIEFDVADAIADQKLRNAKRFVNENTVANTFVNTAIVYIVNAKGNAIASQEIWVPKWEFTIPLQYREQRCSVRLMPKSSAVKFKIFDGGSVWTQVTS